MNLCDLGAPHLCGEKVGGQACVVFRTATWLSTFLPPEGGDPVHGEIVGVLLTG
jgi:hypothetical protein